MKESDQFAALCRARLTIDAKYSIPEEISLAIWSKFSKLSFWGVWSRAATHMQVGS